MMLRNHVILQGSLLAIILLALWLKLAGNPLADLVVYRHPGLFDLTVFDVMFWPALLLISHLWTNFLRQAADLLASSVVGRALLIAIFIIGLLGVVELLFKVPTLTSVWPNRTP